jgi:elongator complex protein 5
VFVAFETTRVPRGVDVFVKARGKGLDELKKGILEALGMEEGPPSTKATLKALLVIDTLHPLSISHPSQLPSFFSAFLTPTTSLLATYHTDIPLPHHPYTPTPLTLLKYLATTLLTTHSLSHVLAQKAARDRSEIEPVFGIEEGEGVVCGLGSNDRRGVVVEMEYRRRSGRGVMEWFFLPSDNHPLNTTNLLLGGKEKAILLTDHPLYSIPDSNNAAELESPAASTLTTFNLDLTDKQREAREGVVLPYYDAQGEGGVGEGGRILYEMGWEDDFDEEEDEI